VPGFCDLGFTFLAELRPPQAPESADLCHALVSYLPVVVERLKKGIHARLSCLVPLGRSLGHRVSLGLSNSLNVHVGHEERA
jgi:hypothetical protein